MYFDICFRHENVKLVLDFTVMTFGFLTFIFHIFKTHLIAFPMKHVQISLNPFKTLLQQTCSPDDSLSCLASIRLLFSHYILYSLFLLTQLVPFCLLSVCVSFLRTFFHLLMFPSLSVFVCFAKFCFLILFFSSLYAFFLSSIVLHESVFFF